MGAVDLTRCDHCGRYGWHTTARCPEATNAEITTEDEPVELSIEQREADICEYQLRDVHRRIRNIEDAYPRDTWTLDEALAVHAALAGLVRVRQGDGALCVTVTITSQSGGPDVEASTRLPNPAVELDQLAAPQ